MYVIPPEITVGEHTNEVQTVGLHHDTNATLSLILHLGQIFEEQVCHRNTTVKTDTLSSVRSPQRSMLDS
jgi:hypothetical protein